MSIRTAVRQSPVLTFAALVAGVWLIFAWFQIFETMDISNTGAIGQGALGGIAGLMVLTVTLGLLFVLFGELGATSPGPSRWPPGE